MTGSGDVMARLRGLGAGLDPKVLAQVQELFLPLHEAEPYAGVRVVRDLAYGPDPRHRLDIFSPAETDAGAPVLVFVHGGGFVAGDKKRPGLPYHDNVALWAARRGMVGVNITYRLAPGHAWPAGDEDVGLAAGWLSGAVADHGGDGERIVLMGTSAGAALVAGWVARAGREDVGKVAGAILLSGIYDLELDGLSANLRAYFGDDPGRYRERSSVHGLVRTDVPLLVTFAELDPPFFQRQALALADAFVRARGGAPQIARLSGHNHFSGTAALNALGGELDRQIEGFLEGVLGVI